MLLISNKISMFDDVVLLFCCFVVLLNVLSWQTTKQPDNKTTKQQNYFSLLIIYFSPEASQSASFGWKPIPSTARVTRDEVSGLQIMKGELSGRQYPIDVLAHLWLICHVTMTVTDWRGCFLVERYCLPDSSFRYHGNPETSSRVTLAVLGTGFQPGLYSLFVICHGLSLAVVYPAQYSRKYNP